MHSNNDDLSWSGIREKIDLIFNVKRVRKCWFCKNVIFGTSSYKFELLAPWLKHWFLFSVLILLVRHNHYSWHNDDGVTPPTQNSEHAASAQDSTTDVALEGPSSKNNPTTYTGYVAPDMKSCTHDKNTRYYKNIDLCEQERVGYTSLSSGQTVRGRPCFDNKLAAGRLKSISRSNMTGNFDL